MGQQNAHISIGCDDGRNDTHDSVESDCNAVASPTMCRRENFRCVCVETTVVNVLHSGVSTREPANKIRFEYTRQKLMAQLKPKF